MKKKIKILQVLGEPVGGVRKHVHSILNNLDRNEFDIFYSYSINEKDKSFKRDINILKDKIADILEINVLKKPHISDIENLIKLIKFIKANNIQIVHGHGAKGGMYSRVVKLFTDVKTIYTPHGGVLHNSFGKTSKFIYTIVEKCLIPFTDAVIVESNYSKNKYIEKIGDIKENLILNYNGVTYPKEEKKIDIPKNLLYKSNNQVNLVIFARLHAMKGQDIAIKSLQYLPDNYILNLFGEGEEKEYLKEIVKSLNLIDRVHFHGDTSKAEEMMKYIDIILIPSFFESFSYVAAEGLMMKRLVIANNVGGLREVLAENSGILIDNIDEKKISKYILDLDKTKKDNLESNGYIRFSKLFTEKRMINSLEEIYKKIIV